MVEIGSGWKSRRSLEAVNLEVKDGNGKVCRDVAIVSVELRERGGEVERLTEGLIRATKQEKGCEHLLLTQSAHSSIAQ